MTLKPVLRFRDMVAGREYAFHVTGPGVVRWASAVADSYLDEGQFPTDTPTPRRQFRATCTGDNPSPFGWSVMSVELFVSPHVTTYEVIE